MPAQNGQKVFGAGRFYGTALPLTTASISTPVPFLVAQDIAVDFKRDIKKLFGQNQLPVDVSAGMLTVTGKVTNGVFSARAFNDMLIGGTLSTGQLPNVANETLTCTTGSTATVAAANGAAFVTDLGIFGATDGVPLVKVSTATAVLADQYSVSTLGVYQFSSLAARTSLKASYIYSTSGGQTVTMTNQAMGRTGGFSAVVAMLWGTEKATITLNNCISSDYGFATKLDDYNKPTFGFEAACDTSDVLGTYSFAELS